MMDEKAQKEDEAEREEVAMVGQQEVVEGDGWRIKRGDSGRERKLVEDEMVTEVVDVYENILTFLSCTNAAIIDWMK